MSRAGKLGKIAGLYFSPQKCVRHATPRALPAGSTLWHVVGRLGLPSAPSPGQHRAPASPQRPHPLPTSTSAELRHRPHRPSPGVLSREQGMMWQCTLSLVQQPRVPCFPTAFLPMIPARQRSTAPPSSLQYCHHHHVRICYY